MIDIKRNNDTLGRMQAIMTMMLTMKLTMTKTTTVTKKMMMMILRSTHEILMSTEMKKD